MADERVDLPTVLVDAVRDAIEKARCPHGQGATTVPACVASARAEAALSAVVDACDGWVEYGVRLTPSGGQAAVDRWLIDRDEAEAEVAYHLAEQAKAANRGGVGDVTAQLIRRVQLTGPAEVVPTDEESSNG